MELKLYPEDLRKKFSKVATNALKYEHFKPKVQRAIRIVGRGVYYDKRGYYPVNPPPIGPTVSLTVYDPPPDIDPQKNKIRAITAGPNIWAIHWGVSIPCEYYFSDVTREVGLFTVPTQKPGNADSLVVAFIESFFGVKPKLVPYSII